MMRGVVNPGIGFHLANGCVRKLGGSHSLSTKLRIPGGFLGLEEANLEGLLRKGTLNVSARAA